MDCKRIGIVEVVNGINLKEIKRMKQRKLQVKRWMSWLMILAIIVTGIPCNIGANTAKAATVVTIPDPYFKQALNSVLGVSDLNADITLEQLETIEYFWVRDSSILKKITDFTGLNYCKNLTIMRCSRA